MRRNRMIALVALAVALALAVPTAFAASGRQIALTGSKAYPAAKGSARYKARQGERELQVEVEHVRSLAGRTVAIYVGGRRLGVVKVGRLGHAELSRNSGRGQRVPVIHAGSRVAVHTAGGTVIARGSF